MEIQLTKVHKSEIQAVSEIYDKIFSEYLGKYHDDAVNPAKMSLEKIAGHFERFDGYHCILRDGEIVGTIEIVHVTWDFEGQDKIYLSNLGILPEYRNQGISQAVFAELERIYQPKDGWELWTIAQEKGNCHLYEKLGYQLSGQKKQVNDLMDLVEYKKRTYRIL
jgi:ribosomal protein S18 acetylase RimI-like enzyme